MDYPNTAPPLYTWLAQQPRGVVLELPAPEPDSLPGDDPRYAYMSTFHWMPLSNGYSGFYPASYLSRLMVLHSFPSEASLIRLRADGIRYVVVHPAAYPPDVGGELLSRIVVSPALLQLGVFPDGRSTAVVFLLR